MIRHPVLTDPTLRMVALLTVLFGAVACTIGPYMSLLAVREFGLGDGGYAALLVISTGVSVAASVYVGIRADQTANRRGMALRACTLSLAGAALMTVAPNVWVFVLAHGLILPLSSTLFGQIFAQARLAALSYPDERRDAIIWPRSAPCSPCPSWWCCRCGRLPSLRARRCFGSIPPA